MSPLTVVCIVATLLFLLGVAFRAFRVQVVLPAAAHQLSAKGQSAAAIHLCERGLRLWTPLGERGRFDLRFYLAFLLMEAKRYADAEAQCRTLLTGGHLPSLRAKATLRLADCLEGQGRSDEAQQERAAVERITGNSSNPDLLLERAALLSKQSQHAEATDIYEAVLQNAPDLPDAARAPLEVKLALSAWHAGRYPLALEATEQALARHALDSTMTRVAHNMASLALTNLSRWEEAIPHAETSLTLTRQEGNPDQIAEALSKLGNVKLQLGQLNEAMALANEALPLSLTGRRVSSLLQAEILQQWGRYDDALAALESAAHAPSFAIPQLAARTQATLALGRARIYVLKGDAPQALEWLDQTTTGFAGDVKLEAWAQAERVTALALLGDRASYGEALAKLNQQLAAIPDDTTARKLAHHAQAEAAHALGDFETMREQWECYRFLAPAPVSLRKAWYGIGVAEAALGRLAEARIAWQNATAPGIDNVWTGLATKRLAEMEQAALRARG